MLHAQFGGKRVKARLNVAWIEDTLVCSRHGASHGRAQRHGERALAMPPHPFKPLWMQSWLKHLGRHEAHVIAIEFGKPRLATRLASLHIALAQRLYWAGKGRHKIIEPGCVNQVPGPFQMSRAIT